MKSVHLKYKQIFQKYQRDYKKVDKRGLNKQLLNDVIKKLANAEKLPGKHKDHALKRGFSGYRECHIQPDWLLIYKKDNVQKILKLVRTGTHSDLF